MDELHDWPPDGVLASAWPDGPALRGSFDQLHRQQLLNAYSELQQQACELRRSNAELEQFAQVVSHDLKSPLQIVLQFAKVLEERCKNHDDEDVGKDIGLILLAVGRMETLIEDVLCYARASQDEPQTRVLTSMNEACETAIANLEDHIVKTEALITYDYLPPISASSGQILRVFQNLIGNAIQYRSAEQPRIHVSCTKLAGEWQFAVRDNGIGIRPEYRQSIFQPFKRLHGSERSGSGLGLAICRRIVEHHRGRMWVESEPGKGSTFFFAFPA